MVNENFDDMMKESLLKGTSKAAELKCSVWESIEQNIQKNNGRVTRLNNGWLKLNSNWLKVGTAAAVMIFILFSFSKPGLAAVKMVKEFFAPEKKITQNLEGMNEETLVTLKESNMGYNIYIDEENYAMVKLKDSDRIVPRKKIQDSNLPEIFMDIKQVKDKTPSQIADELKIELRNSFKNISEPHNTNEPVKSIFIKASTGSTWKDTIVYYYLIDNTEGGTFVVKTQMFLEAAEGHGSRFYNMLKEFRVVEQDK